MPNKVFALLQNVSVNSDKAEYYLSDSQDIADGTLGDKLLLEVASESQGNYKKFTQRVRERNGERIIIGRLVVSGATTG